MITYIIVNPDCSIDCKKTMGLDTYNRFYKQADDTLSFNNRGMLEIYHYK